MPACCQFPLPRRIVALFLIVCIFQSAVSLADELSVKVIGRDGDVVAFTAAHLKALPRSEFEVKDRDGTMAKYSGVEVSHLLVKVGTPQGAKLRGEWMRSFVVIGARDGYRAVYALPEFDAAFTDRKVFLVDSRNGSALAENQGPFQIIAPEEKRHSRWVRMVTEIQIIDSGALSAEKK